MNSIVVKMGGVDVTGDVYSDGVITIPNVTGDIVITAIASGFTNIIDTIGYEQDMRLSTSSGTTKEATGCVTTGMIDISSYERPVTIRTNGVDFRASTNGNCAVALYSDANGTFANATYNNVYSGTSYDMSFDDEGNMTYVAKQTTNFIRFTGYGEGSNLIVTINEEINADGSGSGGDDNTTPTYTTNWLTNATDENGNIIEPTEGVRFNSSGTTTQNATTAITGFIPAVKGDIIRVTRDLWNPSGQSSYYQIKLYDENFEPVENGYYALANIMNNALLEGYSFDNNVVECKLSSSSSTTTTSLNKTKYIRLSVDVAGLEKGVITVNEEIK